MGVDNDTPPEPVEDLQKTAEEVMKMLSSNPRPDFSEYNRYYHQVDKPDTSWDKSSTTMKTKEKVKCTTMKRSECYSMNSPRRGCFMIFNQTKFRNGKNLPKRYEAHRDDIIMKEVAEMLGFSSVKFFPNCTRAQMISKLSEVAKADHSSHDCFGCAISSHGSEGDKIWATDEEVEISEITELFNAENCASLQLKPKLFFIAACRGKKADKGTFAKNTCTVQADSGPFQENVIIPTQADFFLAYACPSGFVSYRRNDEGTWFVNMLHKVVQENKDKLHSIEIMQLMTKVNNAVCSRSTEDGDMQCPSIVSRLCSELYFKPVQINQAPSSDVQMMES